jgi:hypothetical protein
MRRFLVVFALLGSVGGLSACGSAPADWTYTPLENFDPAQVSMLPHNPYQGTSGVAATPIAPQPRAQAAVSSGQ